MEIIKRKRQTFGYTYSLSNISSLQEYIKPQRKFVEITQERIHHVPSKDWLLDMYTDEELLQKFNKCIKVVFNEIENNNEWKDSTLI